MTTGRINQVATRLELAFIERERSAPDNSGPRRRAPYYIRGGGVGARALRETHHRHPRAQDKRAAGRS